MHLYGSGIVAGGYDDGIPSCLATLPHFRTPDDLTTRHCIDLHMQSDGLLIWAFGKGRREVKVRAEGRLVLDTTLMALTAAVAGYVLADGLRNRVRADGCAAFSGRHHYHMSRRQAAPAFLAVNALRY